MECPECKKSYCSTCIHPAHGVVDPDGTVKSEYTETSHAHFDKIVRCNGTSQQCFFVSRLTASCVVCLECRDKDVEFYCVNCDVYQCEVCCASFHLTNATDHSYFAVQGE